MFWLLLSGPIKCDNYEVEASFNNKRNAKSSSIFAKVKIILAYSMVVALNCNYSMN